MCIRLGRLQKMVTEGVLLPGTEDILDYWRRRTIAGLLLVPATRHNLVHLNEIYALNQKK